MSKGDAEMGEAEQAKGNDDERGWNRDEEGETAGVFRSEQVKQADDEDGRRRELFRVRDAQV